MRVTAAAFQPKARSSLGIIGSCFGLGRRRVDLQRRSVAGGALLRRRLHGPGASGIGALYALDGLCRLLRHVLDHRGVVRGGCGDRQLPHCRRRGPARARRPVAPHRHRRRLRVDRRRLGRSYRSRRARGIAGAETAAELLGAYAHRCCLAARLLGARHRLLRCIERHHRCAASPLRLPAAATAVSLASLKWARQASCKSGRRAPSRKAGIVNAGSLARGRGALLIDFHGSGARDEARGQQHAEQARASVCVHTIYPPTEARPATRRPEGSPLISTCRTISVPPTQSCPQAFFSRRQLEVGAPNESSAPLPRRYVPRRCPLRS